MRGVRGETRAFGSPFLRSAKASGLPAPGAGRTAGRPAWAVPSRDGSSSGLNGQREPQERAARPPADQHRAERSRRASAAPRGLRPCPPAAVPGRALAPLGAGLRESRRDRANRVGKAGTQWHEAQPAALACFAPGCERGGASIPDRPSVFKYARATVNFETFSVARPGSRWVGAPGARVGAGGGNVRATRAGKAQSPRAVSPGPLLSAETPRQAQPRALRPPSCRRRRVAGAVRPLAPRRLPGEGGRRGPAEALRAGCAVVKLAAGGWTLEGDPRPRCRGVYIRHAGPRQPTSNRADGRAGSERGSGGLGRGTGSGLAEPCRAVPRRAAQHGAAPRRGAVLCRSSGCRGLGRAAAAAAAAAPFESWIAGALHHARQIVGASWSKPTSTRSIPGPR